jgi:nitrate reductase molybdenum cofactor assembly chaperone NarJ/NarW
MSRRRQEENDMGAPTSSAYAVLAQALDYPVPGRLETLAGGLTVLPEGPAKAAYRGFVERLRGLSLGEWEELFTRTLDLNPPAAPYVGYQIWGESYQRGAFLASMSRELRETGIDTGGELPDHLAPVLHYLACSPHPLPDLIEGLGPALDRILKALRTTDPDNPYVSLFQAVQAACRALKKEDA